MVECLTTIVFAGAAKYRQAHSMTTKTRSNVDVKTLLVTLSIAQFFTLRTIIDNAHPTARIIVAEHVLKEVIDPRKSIHNFSAK